MRPATALMIPHVRRYSWMSIVAVEGRKVQSAVDRDG